MSWQYEALFGRELNTDEADLTNWWRSEASAIPVGRMGYRSHITLAGPRMECEIYPAFGRADEIRVRAAKTNVTPEKMRKLNEKRAVRHLAQLLDANFSEKDLHVTLTYRGDPPTMDQCRRDMRNYIGKLKRYREKMGLDPLKYIWVMEGGWDDMGGYGKQRLHIHMVTNGGISREDMEAMWERGYANSDRLQPQENGLEELAKYISKQRQKGRRWCASRNLTQPLERKTDARVSNAAVKRIAYDIRNEAKEEMEKRYPSYRFVDCQVYYSDVIDGVYIRVLMRKKDRGLSARNRARTADGVPSRAPRTTSPTGPLRRVLAAKGG